MTEWDWLTGGDGATMFAGVRDRLSPRKWVLLACGVARQFAHDFDNDNFSGLIDGVESSADRSLGDNEIDRLYGLIPERFLPWLDPTEERGRRLFRDHHELAQLILEFHDGGLWTGHPGQARVLAPILREQLGNPFRPYPFDPAWRTETVLALAAGIDTERAFDRMPILADALEEAGCDVRPMLDHLRGPGPHARGCWVLDLILNREPGLFSQPPLTPTGRRMRLGPFTPPRDDIA